MHLLCLGISHRTAPVELREDLWSEPHALHAALARFGCGDESRPTGYAELAILSTCNRIELYAAAHSTQFDGLRQLLSDLSDQPWPQFAPYAYEYVDEATVSHLCRVAASLDSLILGEPQILGQVTEAYEAARGQDAAGPILSALFRTAIRAGKRAHTETGIGRNPASASSVAVRQAQAVLGDLSGARVLILGAGEMAELALKALRQRGVQHITAVNRTHQRATQLADRWSARTLTFEHLAEGLAASDLVIASTAAPHIIVDRELARNAIARRPDRPLVFVDIAVPRNVDPAVGQIPGVHYFDIDDLQARLEGYQAEREQEIPRVEAIVAEEAAAFNIWLHSLEVTPLITSLRAKADHIRRQEIEKTFRHLPHLDQAERERIEALAEALINKLLHDPIQRLKTEAHNGRAAEYAAAARDLFALDAISPHD